MPIVKLVALVMIVSTMLIAGLQVDRQRVMETLRHYSLIGRALLANFVLVPLFAVLLVRVFHVETGISIGIVLMSMAPGVPFLANSAGRSGGGSLSFALTITFFFAALSVVTIPVTIEFLLPPAAAAEVPVAQFLTTLVLCQLLPLLFGAFLATRLTQAAVETLARYLRIVFLLAAAAVVVLIFPRLVSSVASVYGFGHLLIIAAIGIFSLGIGWLLGGPDGRYRRTLSIATLMRNVGLCTLVGSAPAFADTNVVPTIVAYFLVAVVLSLPVRIFFKRTKEAPA